MLDMQRLASRSALGIGRKEWKGKGGGGGGVGMEVCVEVAALVWWCVWRWRCWHGGVCVEVAALVWWCVWRWQRWRGGVCGGGSVDMEVWQC